MPTNPETLTIPINERDSLTALLYASPKKDHAGITVILGHGAGGNQLSPFMRLFASGLPERDAHLKDIKAPMLFVQGSRDAFGTAEEIRKVIASHRLRATLYVIEGGDHSFKVPKSYGSAQQQIHENVMDEIARWLRSQ